MLHYLIVRQPRSYPATCGFDHFVTDATHKREPSKGNWAPFICTSRASLRKQDVLWETSSVAKGEEKRLFYFSSFPFGCFMQAQRLESRLLSFMSKYKDLYGPRNTPWILLGYARERNRTRLNDHPKFVLVRVPWSWVVL